MEIELFVDFTSSNINGVIQVKWLDNTAVKILDKKSIGYFS